MPEYTPPSNTIGQSSISSDIAFRSVYTFTGEVIAVSEIKSNTGYRTGIVINGSVAGTGRPKYKMNMSKSVAFNPILIHQNLPYNVGDCPIVAIEYEGFSPNKIINIISTEDSVYENTNDFHVYESSSKNGNNFPITHYPYSLESSGLIEYLVTDYRADDGNGDPLFYQYELMFDSYSEITTESIVQIYKNNDIKLKKGVDYLVQHTSDLLSSNDRYSTTNWSSTRDAATSYRTRILLPSVAADTNVFYTVEYIKIMNDIKGHQKELIELKPIYDSTDFGIGEDGVYIKSGSIIPADITTLHVQKNPYKRIAPLDITVVKDNPGSQSYVPDQTSSWNLRVNVGSFLIGSGFYSSQQNMFYNIDEQVPSGIPVTNVKPEIVSDNIIRLPASPIEVDISEGKYVYPTYNIDVYDKINDTLTDAIGKISIETNGTTRTDIKILSIDREKGYILFDRNVSAIDELELTYYLSNSGYVALQNLELNPKVDLPTGSTGKHISEFTDGLGLAIRPYNSGNIQTTYPMVYDLSEEENSRTCYSIAPVTTSGDIVSWSGSFITIAELGFNKLNTDLVKMTDARKIGGGLLRDNNLNTWFKNNLQDTTKYFEKNWYSDVGNYDGDPLAHSSMIIIHMPSDTLSGIYSQWENHYLSNIDNADEARRKSGEEYNFWLDQTIRKYISAGSDYILISTISGDFNSSNIERLNF